VNDIGLQPVHQFSDAAPENGQEIEQLLFGAVAVGQHGVWHDHGHAGNGGLDGPRPGLFPGSGEQAGGDPIVGHTLQVGGIQRRVAGRQDMQIDAPADRLCRDLLQIDPGAGLPGQLAVDKENPSSSARATPLADRLDPLRNLGPRSSQLCSNAGHRRSRSMRVGASFRKSTPTAGKFEISGSMPDHGLTCRGCRQEIPKSAPMISCRRPPGNGQHRKR
jgi:hypothetical protein